MDISISFCIKTHNFAGPSRNACPPVPPCTCTSQRNKHIVTSQIGNNKFRRSTGVVFVAHSHSVSYPESVLQGFLLRDDQSQRSKKRLELTNATLVLLLGRFGLYEFELHGVVIVDHDRTVHPKWGDLHSIATFLRDERVQVILWTDFPDLSRVNVVASVTGFQSLQGVIGSVHLLEHCYECLALKYSASDRHHRVDLVDHLEPSVNDIVTFLHSL